MQNLDAGKRKCWRLSAIILSLISAVLLSYVLLVGSILAVVYLTPGYFEKEYEKYDVLSSLPEMTMSEEDGLMAVTKHMKHFLLHGQQPEELQIEVMMDGEMRPLDRSHGRCACAVYGRDPFCWIRADSYYFADGNKPASGM